MHRRIDHSPRPIKAGKRYPLRYNGVYELQRRGDEYEFDVN